MIFKISYINSYGKIDIAIANYMQNKGGGGGVIGDMSVLIGE